MAGVSGRRYADGCWRIWIIDRHGKQIFLKGTRSRRESYNWAMMLEARERAIRLGIIPAPSGEEIHRDDPIEGVITEYLDWGRSQGGLRKRGWSSKHEKTKRTHLAYWVEALQLRILGDLRNRLADAEACVRELKEQWTNKTCNEYINALTSWCSWCDKRGYLDDNPFMDLELLDGEPEFERRALTVEEIGRLLDCADPDRRILYEAVLLSGLRANEARQLSVKDLRLKQEGFHLSAKWTKGRRECLQPLPGWFLKRLQAYGEQKTAYALYRRYGKDSLKIPADPLLFVPRDTARSLDVDLKRAGIDKDPEKGKLDFHALRTSFSTLLDEAGATEKTKEVLLRHGPSTLAHKRYVKVRPEQPGQVVNKVAERLGLTKKYANGMPDDQEQVDHQNS